MACMLEGLDDYDWGGLIHAYGPASDVPGDLRDLLSSDQKIRDGAMHRLYGNIYHQGTVYTATVVAIPFLVEIAVAPETPDRDKVMGLLAAIAEPTAENFLQAGETVGVFREKAAQEERELTDEQIRDCEQFGFWPSVAVDTYDAVLSSLPQLCTFFDSGDDATIAVLCELVGYFPEYADQALPKLEHVLHSTSSGPAREARRTAAFGALAQLARSVEVGSQDAILSSWLDPATPLFTRVSAALGCQEDTAEVRETLLAALKNADALIEMDREMPNQSGWTVSAAANRLSNWAESDRDRVVKAMIDALPVMAAAGIDRTSMIGSLVKTLVCPDMTKDHFKGRTRQDLTSLELSALRAIGRHGPWMLGDRVFGNFAMQMKGYGLPDNLPGLRRYVLGPLKAGLGVRL